VPPENGRHWRVEVRGGPADGTVIDAITLPWALSWFRILASSVAREQVTG
jgi:hypothetical protein